MAVTLHDSGTQTATVTTEHTLEQVSVAGVFVFNVDLSNMAAGDIVEIRVKRITLSAGDLELVKGYPVIFYGAQFDPSWESEVFANDLAATGALTLTLKQTFGTGRNFPWKVMKA